MRIALVADTYIPQVNGVTTVLRRQVEALTARGIPTLMVAPAYPDGTAAPHEHRVRSVAFPPYPEIRLSLPFAGTVARALDAHAPDVVHVATEGPLGLVGRAWALKHGVPLVTSFHTDFPRYCTDWHVPALAPAVWRWVTWFHGPAQLTHAPGEQARDMLQARGLSQTVVWGRGVNSHFFHPARAGLRWRRRFGVADDTALILHVGRLAPEKNIETLIEAFRLAHATLGSRAEFVVAGDGPRRPLVDARLPWARRVGFIAREDLADLYAAADGCVLTSASETCGLVALEALASGVPVIAANAGGLRESVIPGVNGFLADPEDPRGFASHIVQLVIESGRHEALRRAARESIRSRDAGVEDEELVRQYQRLAGVSPARETECAA